MIPVIALDVKPGQKVLDMCASPGSKTTQISENLDNRGVVVANEIANSRINTLVSNVQRHGSRTPMIVHHDGRHIPKIPGKGYDRVLVDAPCTGSGTTRKNPEVWKKWLPSGSRALHRLQLELLGKAIDVSRPGGRIVYSTCSLDPIENEAVIAEILRKYPVNVISASEILDLVPHEEGFQDWPILDDRGVIDDSLTVSNSMLPPKEVEIIDAMKKCVRIWNDKIDGGGFFVTILEKSKINIGEEGAIKTVIDNHVKPDAETFPKPIDRKMKKKIINSLGKCPDNLWIRGKKILWSTKEAMFIWEQEKSRKSGRIIIPGKRWRPLKVIDIGLSTIKLRNGEIDRIVGRAATQIIPEIQEGYMEVSGEIIDRLLIGDQIFPREIEIELDSFRGGLILIDDRNDACIPVWIGKKVSLMINESEQIILRAIRGLEITINEEE